MERDGDAPRLALGDGEPEPVAVGVTDGVGSGVASATSNASYAVGTPATLPFDSTVVAYTVTLSASGAPGTCVPSMSVSLT